jgi:hypothetical protein
LAASLSLRERKHCCLETSKLKKSQLACRAAWALLTFSPAYSYALTELVLQLDTSLRHDSNPLRFANDANVLAVLGTNQKRDLIVANDVRFSVVHPLDSPQTRLALTGNLGYRNYNHLGQLDNTEYAYLGAFEWRYGNLWRGEMSHRDENVLANYLDGSLTQRNMLRVQSNNVEVALRATPDIDIPLALQSRQTQFELPANALFATKEKIADLGVRYLTETKSSLRGGVRTNKVTFNNRTTEQVALLDSGFTDNELYLESDWQYSIKTRVSARVSALTRHYESLDAKNFTALTTEIKSVYEYSPKTRFFADVWRRPFGLNDRNILYTINTGAQFGMRWQATAKSRFNVAVLQEQQRYQLINPAAQASADATRYRLTAGVVYALSRDLRIYADGYADKLNRGAYGAPISQNFVRTGIEYTYENLPNIGTRLNAFDRR